MHDVHVSSTRLQIDHAPSTGSSGGTGTVLRISFLGFNPIGHGYDGRGLIDVGADRTFSSLDTLGALRLIRRHFQLDRNGRAIAEPGPQFDLRITGYSYGGWSALQVAHALRPLGSRFRIRLGLVDPVYTFRSRRSTRVTYRRWVLPIVDRWPLPSILQGQAYASRPDYVVSALNYYQTRGLIARYGGTGFRLPFRSNWFVSQPIPGFENIDVSSEVTDESGHCDIADRYAKIVAARTFEPDV